MNRLWCAYILTAGLLAACANSPTHTGPPAPQAWVGSTEGELTKCWGKPFAQMLNERNHRVVAYLVGTRVLRPADFHVKSREEDLRRWFTQDGGELPSLAQTGGEVRRHTCHVLFELQNGRVIRWDWRGSGCGRVKLPVRRAAHIDQASCEQH